MNDLLALFDWRSLAVFRRNALVFARNWRTAFLPPLMEPLIFFLAFGLGLGGRIGAISFGSTSVSYATWVAAGLLAYTGFNVPFFEGLYSSYVRMFYQKTWSGILTTQVEIPHIVWGEITWAAARGAMNVAVVSLVLCTFNALGLISINAWWLLIAPPVSWACGCAFAAFALIFTAIVPAIDHINFPVYLVGLPLGFISNTYFPLHPNRWLLKALMFANPIYHLAETYRCLFLNQPVVPQAAGLVVSTWCYATIFCIVAHKLIRRRVLKE